MDIDGIKISELTRVDSVSDNDDFVVNSGGVTHKTRFSVIKGNIVQYVNGFIDAVNQALIGEVSNRTQADNQLSGRIDNEVTARQSADSTLGGRIDAEVSARGLADVELGSRISAESTARQSADSALSGRIDAEVSARQSADNVLSEGLISETNARESADSALSDRINELKGTLDGKVNYHLITASDGYTSNASKTALRNYCDSLTSKIPIMFTLDAGSLGFGYMFKGSSNYALIVYYQYGNGTITQVAMTKYGGTWSDWFNI